MAISATFVANKKRLIYWILKTSASCHFALSDIMDGQNGWSVSAPHQPPPFTWIMWCKPKVARVVSLSVPPPLPSGAPAGRKDPLPRLEWLLLGLLCRWQGREGGRRGYTDLENIVNSPQPPPSPSTPSYSPIPCPYLPSPTYRQTVFLLYVCVYVGVCTCHLSPYGLSLVDACVRERDRLCMCVCFHTGLLVWLCMTDF